jgi:molecular chaperone GrpE
LTVLKLFTKVKFFIYGWPKIWIDKKTKIIKVLSGGNMENSTKLDPESKIEQEENEVEKLKEELKKEHDMYLRALADFDNFKRRVERDRDIASQAGKKELFISLLGVIDNFERALEHIDEVPESIATGIKSIHKQILSLLESEGVIAFDSVGEAFDPNLHEAIAMVEMEDKNSGTVFDELKKGYIWNKELLRPAQVRVVQ